MFVLSFKLHSQDKLMLVGHHWLNTLSRTSACCLPIWCERLGNLMWSCCDTREENLLLIWMTILCFEKWCSNSLNFLKSFYPRQLPLRHWTSNLNLKTWSMDDITWFMLNWFIFFHLKRNLFFISEFLRAKFLDLSCFHRGFPLVMSFVNTMYNFIMICSFQLNCYYTLSIQTTELVWTLHVLLVWF